MNGVSSVDRLAQAVPTRHEAGPPPLQIRHIPCLQIHFELDANSYETVVTIQRKIPESPRPPTR